MDISPGEKKTVAVIERWLLYREYREAARVRGSSTLSILCMLSFSVTGKITFICIVYAPLPQDTLIYPESRIFAPACEAVRISKESTRACQQSSQVCKLNQSFVFKKHCFDITLYFVLELSRRKWRLCHLHHVTPASSIHEKHVNSFDRTRWHTSRVASSVLAIFKPTSPACHPTWRMTLKDCVLTTVPLFLCSTAVSRERFQPHP